MRFFIIFSFLFNSAFSLTSQTMQLGWFTTAHILIVNPQEHQIIPIRAKGKDARREPVLTLAKRYGALAAINGGFWKTDGTPAGVLRIDGRWYGHPVHNRGAIGWTEGGKHVLIDRMAEKESWSAFEHIVGGAPVLIQNGTIIEDYQPEKTSTFFLKWWHPRTAVGIRPNGDWVFAVIDGRLCGLFGGMTIKELAYFMRKLGCVDALNLDGGGSSTLIINDRVVNEPRGSYQINGKWVETVSDAILVLP